MFVDMYGNQFTIDDLRQKAKVDVLEELEKLYLSALGINLDEENKEEKRNNNPEQARDSLLAWVQQLMQQGYTITEIKKLKTSDLELMVHCDGNTSKRN